MVQKINPHPAQGCNRSPPLLCIIKRCNSWECSVHFFRGPWPGQARTDYLAPLFDDNTIILKNDDRRFIVLLTEYVPCTYFHKNNKSQLDIPFMLECRNPISLTALFALTAKKTPKPSLKIGSVNKSFLF